MSNRYAVQYWWQNETGHQRRVFTQHSSRVTPVSNGGFMKILILLCATFFQLSAFAASRYYYDVQKFKAILDSKEVEARLGMVSLEGIEQTGIDDAKRTITYRLKSPDCMTDVVLSYEDDMNPNYQVSEIGVSNCLPK